MDESISWKLKLLAPMQHPHPGLCPCHTQPLVTHCLHAVAREHVKPETLHDATAPKLLMTALEYSFESGPHSVGHEKMGVGQG